MRSDFAEDPRTELSALRAPWAYAYANSPAAPPSIRRSRGHQREHALLERIRRTSRGAHLAEDPAHPWYGLCGTPLADGVTPGSGRCVVCLDFALRGFVAR